MSAAAAGTDGASISWTAPAGAYCDSGTNPVTSYKIEQSADGGGSWSTVDAATTTNPYAATGLARGSYNFHVSANKAIGSGKATVASETITVAGLPQAITLPSITDTAVNAGPVALSASASSGFAVGVFVGYVFGL